MPVTIFIIVFDKQYDGKWDKLILTLWRISLLFYAKAEKVLFSKKIPVITAIYQL